MSSIRIENDKLIIPFTRHITFTPKKLEHENFGTIKFEHKMLSGTVTIEPTKIDIHMLLNYDNVIPIDKIRKLIEAYDKAKAEAKPRA